MAMTLRFPPELDSAIQKIADAQHTSKHSLVLRAVEEMVSRDDKTRLVLASLDETSRDYADLIERLKDA
jgi:predicted transcriptional regulator